MEGGGERKRGREDRIERRKRETEREGGGRREI